MAYTAATLPAAPVIARVMPGGIYWATAAAAAAPMVAEDWVDGSLILAPNSCVTIQGVGRHVWNRLADVGRDSDPGA